jgi:hypothetical protein
MIEDQVKKFTVEENGKKVDVVIGMTEEEAKDKSYVDYLESGYTEKTKEQIRKQPPKPAPKASNEDIRGALREAIEYKRRRQMGGGKKYF